APSASTCPTSTWTKPSATSTSSWCARPRRRSPPASQRSDWSGRALEGVAIADLAAAVAGQEPAPALLRRAVIEAVGNDIALGALLQRIVADLEGGIERFVDIAFLEQALLLGVVRPDAGIAVCLQLDAHRHGVGHDLAHRLAGAVELRQHVGQVLDMMADLVGDDIGLGEIAMYAETAFEGLEEI